MADKPRLSKVQRLEAKLEKLRSRTRELELQKEIQDLESRFPKRTRRKRVRRVKRVSRKKKRG